MNPSPAPGLPPASDPGPAASAGGRRVLDLLTLAAGYLEKKGVPAARREADALLGHVLGCDRLHLYLRFEESPAAEEVDRFRALMRRRGEREPLQYLTGRVRFAELELACDRRALIPRPETEDLAKLVAGLAGDGHPGRCADIGTGGGCIALHMASKGAAVLATDADPGALALARENAAALGLDGRIRFAQGPLYGPLAGEEPFDLIVSNPPYIAVGEKSGLQPEVARWEPEAALFAGAEGLDVLLPLLDGAPARLRPGGWLALECGPGQARALAQRARASDAWALADTRRDSFAVERFLVCQKSQDRGAQAPPAPDAAPPGSVDHS
jgi:release factor glutamine methyltransferase